MFKFLIFDFGEQKVLQMKRVYEWLLPLRDDVNILQSDDDATTRLELGTQRKIMIGQSFLLKSVRGTMMTMMKMKTKISKLRLRK